MDPVNMRGIEPPNTKDYYEYKKVDSAAGKTAENGERFALNYGQKENKAKESEKKETDGVVVELSGKTAGQSGNAASYSQWESRPYPLAEEPVMSDTVAGVRGLLEKITKTVSHFFSTVRDTLLDFWNSDSPKNPEQAGQTPEGMEQAPEEAGQGEVRMLEAAERERTSGGVVHVEGVVERASVLETVQEKDGMEKAALTGKPAKNSDLLTYYDRRGQLVKLSGSDRNRILRGNRNELKG